MKCPLCGVDDDKVIDSRAAEEGGAIRRRRECLACGRRFTTFERVEEVPLVVIKRSGAVVPFERARIIATSGTIPLPGRPLSALLARVGPELILFDCGEGTQVSMRRAGWGFKSLSAICLSHLHADHVAGLPGLLLTVANAGRTEPLDIFGPVHTRSVVAGLR